jgi:hypothetical protein
MNYCLLAYIVTGLAFCVSCLQQFAGDCHVQTTFLSVGSGGSFALTGGGSSSWRDVTEQVAIANCIEWLFCLGGASLGWFDLLVMSLKPLWMLFEVETGPSNS